MTTKPNFINKDVRSKIIEDYKNKPYPFSDIRFLVPLAYWYEYMTHEQKKDLPPRVLNALDSLHMILKGRL